MLEDCLADVGNAALVRLQTLDDQLQLFEQICEVRQVVLLQQNADLVLVFLHGFAVVVDQCTHQLYALFALDLDQLLHKSRDHLTVDFVFQDKRVVVYQLCQRGLCHDVVLVGELQRLLDEQVDELGSVDFIWAELADNELYQSITQLEDPDLLRRTLFKYHRLLC